MPGRSAPRAIIKNTCIDCDRFIPYTDIWCFEHNIVEEYGRLTVIGEPITYYVNIHNMKSRSDRFWLVILTQLQKHPIARTIDVFACRYYTEHEATQAVADLEAKYVGP